MASTRGNRYPKPSKSNPRARTWLQRYGGEQKTVRDLRYSVWKNETREKVASAIEQLNKLEAEDVSSAPALSADIENLMLGRSTVHTIGERDIQFDLMFTDHDTFRVETDSETHPSLAEIKVMSKYMTEVLGGRWTYNPYTREMVCVEIGDDS
jgi:hypothetical protein